jgi:16S rRNA pseudouridine516 synthase
MLELERLLQRQGFGTRKACAAMIIAGQVAVRGAGEDAFRVWSEPAAKVEPAGLHLRIGGEVWPVFRQVYIAMNKPPAHECSTRPSHHRSVLSLLPAHLRNRGVQCVGRLDQDTTGLLLLSDDGDFIHSIISPKKHLAKVYMATTKHPIDDHQLAALGAGVVLRDSPQAVRAISCRRLDAHRLELSIAEGRYHQVKRMVAAAGNRVEALHRVTIGSYSLPSSLAPGAWTWLGDAELASLQYV